MNTWIKIQLDVFSSVRVSNYIKFSCRADSDRDLYYSMSTLFKIRWHLNDEYHELRLSLIEYDLRSLSKRTWKSRVYYTSRARCKVHDTNVEERISYIQFIRSELHVCILLINLTWTDQNTSYTRAYSLNRLCAIQCSHYSLKSSQMMHLKIIILWKSFSRSNLRSTMRNEMRWDVILHFSFLNSISSH